MGIPLYRERSCIAAASQVKIPAVCPYATSTGTHTPRQHHHHHTAQQADASRESTAQDTPQGIARALESSAASGRVWRSAPRAVPPTRSSDRTAESHERSTARYTSRIVRSQPGTREHEDELRAAELVELYFSELTRVRAAVAPTSDANGIIDADATRPSTERVLGQYVRRQQRAAAPGATEALEAASIAAHVSNRVAERRETSRQYRSLHDSLVREQQRTHRSPRSIEEQMEQWQVDQEMTEEL